ncbi:Chitobiosyldiphosphodolichol beta-mannosyltransferase, partial [Trichinella pseudospiralis]
MASFEMEKAKQHVALVVLGDIGRSPRMEYHSLLFAKHNFHVNLVGYAGSLFFTLIYCMLFQIPKIDLILVQNPPGLPALLVCMLVAKLRRCRFVIDWHNYTWSMLAYKWGNGSEIVRFALWMEFAIAAQADASFCVTNKMQASLKKREQHEFLMKMAMQEAKFTYVENIKENKYAEANRFTALTNDDRYVKLPDRPCLLISSTSWTPDENFTLLLDALDIYWSSISNEDSPDAGLPSILMVITGNGPLKEQFKTEVTRRKFFKESTAKRKIEILTMWLKAEDYPKLLACADLGISLHVSTSGEDLPMKIVDMFGCHLPVLAKKFGSIGELVHDGENGHVFNNAAELADQLKMMLKGFAEDKCLIKTLKEKFKSNLPYDWDKTWETTVWPKVLSSFRQIIYFIDLHEHSDGQQNTCRMSGKKGEQQKHRKYSLLTKILSKRESQDQIICDACTGGHFINKFRQNADDSEMRDSFSALLAEEPKIDDGTSDTDSSSKWVRSTLDIKATEECQTKKNFVRKLSYGNIKGDTTDSYDNSEKNTKIDLLHLVHKFQSRNPVLFKAENDMKTMKQIRIKQIALATAHFKQATEDLSFSSEKEPESREKLKLDNEEIMMHFTDLKNLISAFNTEHRNYDMSQKLGLKYVHHLGIRKNARTDILFAVFLKDVHMTCVLEELELSTGWIPFCGIRTVWGKSFDECILICNSLRPENKCNAIKYYQTLMKCYLLTAPKNSRATETQHESHKVIFIYGCSKGSYYLHEIENFSMLVLGGTFISLKIEILNKTFIIERRPTADSILLPIASLLVMRGFGRLDAMLSSIILEQAYVNSVVIKATHNMSYELISESRSPVGESGPNSKQAEQTSMEAYVHLYRYMEVCKISVIHGGKIENVTSIQIISNVRSINRCLHFCRPWLHQIFYCAVIYTKHNYKCELLKRNTERSITRFVDDESNLIELLNCYPDRQHERRNNPPPMRYYLKQTGEICVLEFYNATQLSSFNPIETLENIENIKSCIYACRLRYFLYLCLAINYTMKKQCTLLRKELEYKIYNVEHRSLFAEILFCEPGTFVNPDYNNFISHTLSFNLSYVFVMCQALLPATCLFSNLGHYETNSRRNA